MNKVNLWHLSDLHISVPVIDWYKNGSKTIRQGLVHLVNQSKSWKHAPDGLIITGDLCDAGTNRHMTQAAKYVYGTRHERASRSLKQWRDRKLIVPGNHDRFQSYMKLPGGGNFDLPEHGFWNGADNNGVDSWVCRKNGTPVLAVIVADFTLRRFAHQTVPFGYLAQGKVYSSTLDQLEKTTANLRNRYESIGVVWGVHFPPNYQTGNLREFRRLIGSSHLLMSARKNKIDVILAGHQHQASRYTSMGVTILSVGSVKRDFFQPETPNVFYHQLSISKIGKVSSSTIEYFWDPKTQLWGPNLNQNRRFRK